MKKNNKVLIKKVKETPVEKGSCGARKRLISEKDSTLLAISHLTISNARKHYHEKTTEFYYVLKGKGSLEIDERLIALEEGMLVKIDPGVAHRALSSKNLEVLVIMSPPYGEVDDQIFI